ncbi:FkbM family methyltransferase [Rhodobacteraceae bacterium NNCM2]|nr:FkbM family methyltransferase [Coraliihabitans acroporae]
MLDLAFPERGTISIPVQHKSHIARSLKGVGIQAFEPLSQAAFLAAAERKPGDIVDIGANIGLYSMLVSCALGRRVHAFEPFEEAAGALEQVAAESGLEISVLRAAVSSFDGEATFYLSKKSDMSNSLDSEHREHRGERKVPVRSIDSWAQDLPLSAVKIDTERTEIDVLNGMIETVRRARPAILVEILSDRQADALAAWQSATGYKGVHIGADDFYRRVLGPFELPDAEGDRRNSLLLPVEFELDEAFFERTRVWADAVRGCAL